MPEILASGKCSIDLLLPTGNSFRIGFFSTNWVAFGLVKKI
jgi:hypothetical protein